MAKLIIDIETIGENYDEMDEVSKHELTKKIQEFEEDKDLYNNKLEDIKNKLGLSPLTGEIVAIGLLDYEKDQGVVYYQAPTIKEEDSQEGNFKFKPMKEQEMLENFWQGVQNYDEIITFNGRGFDIPYIIARSAKWQIEVTENLMPNRYIENQKYGFKHVDLYDQLGYYGAVGKTGGLHMWCRLLGIKSPKEGGVKGDDVNRLFKEEEYLKIAQYNTRDLVATKELYDYWNRFMKLKN